MPPLPLPHLCVPPWLEARDDPSPLQFCSGRSMADVSPAAQQRTYRRRFAERAVLMASRAHCSNSSG
jgi:hypothetical protein